MEAQESLLTREEVERRVGLSRSTIYARMAVGSFPAARREVETGNVRWLASEIDAWIADWIGKAEPVVGTVAGSRRERMKKPLKSVA